MLTELEVRYERGAAVWGVHSRWKFYLHSRVGVNGNRSRHKIARSFLTLTEQVIGKQAESGVDFREKRHWLIFQQADTRS